MFFKPNLEKMFNVSSKSELIEVLDINGDLKLEGSTQRLLVVEEEQLVLKERKNDQCLSNILLKNQ